MYARKEQNGLLNHEFIAGLDIFINFTWSKPTFMGGSKIKCSCMRCSNQKYLSVDEVKLHLLKQGFKPNYSNLLWI